jgi:hypothetical protein
VERVVADEIEVIDQRERRGRPVDLANGDGSVQCDDQELVVESDDLGPVPTIRRSIVWRRLIRRARLTSL